MKYLSTIKVDDSVRDPIRVGESVLEFQAKRERYCDHELSSGLILVWHGLYSKVKEPRRERQRKLAFGD